VERFASVAREINLQCGAHCPEVPERRVPGGSMSECYRWMSGADPLFVKVGAHDAAAMYAAEAAGLQELAGARAVRVPRVLAHGQAGALAFLALEWIEPGAASAECEARLGAGLAALHAHTAARFGWLRDNTIGRTPQANAWSEDWTEFFRERRLRPQLELADARGHGQLLGDAGGRLLAALPRLLGAHRPAASLLHGDLWGGNWMATDGAEPVLIDPAVYYGDRETDLAMTRLFGGFGPAFYRAYEAAAPLPPGAPLRTELYNLYHLLNHANLFGGTYVRQARSRIDRLLSQA
jgi:protein-ribulosamine 3-kinase